MGKTARARVEPAATTDLDQVLDTENRLTKLLAEAEAEARQLVASARLESQRLEQEAPLALDLAVTRLREGEAAFQDAELKKIQDWLRSESERYRKLSDADLSRLADLALQTLLGGLS